MFITSRGFSLLELVIALFLGSLIILGITRAYTFIEQGYISQKALTTITSRAQNSSYYLMQAVHLAGFMACRSLSARQSTLTAVKGYAAYNTELSMLNPKRIVADSNIIVINYLEPQANLLYAMTANQLLISAQPKRDKHQNLWIADCSNIEALGKYNYSASSGQTLLLANNLKHVYGSSALLARPVKQVFYLGKTGRYDRYGNEIISLWMYDSRLQNNVELIPHIQTIEIKYGIKDEAGISYMNSDKVSDWHAIAIIKFTLIIQSDIPFHDEYLQKEWIIYAALRQQ